MPDDLAGKRVLDIGAWDGYFAFAAEKRGAAQVVAADMVTAPGFRLAKRLLHSQVAAIEVDIMDLDPEKIGAFDLVLCLGVLHHLKHPLMALERVCRVTAERLILETYVDMLDCPRPAMAFYPGAELNGDPSNWCGPNPAMVIAMLRTAGFRRAEMYANTLSGNGYAENRAVFHAWK
jgi:tRNA (mo5U34)-methyltransferase